MRLAFGLGAIVLVAGCGDDDGENGAGTVEPSRDTSTGNPTTLAASVATVTERLFVGDATYGYQQLSAACRNDLTQEEYNTSLVVLFNGFAEANELFGELAVIDAETRSLDADSGEARPVITHDEMPLAFELDWQPWVLEDGAWKLDCDPADMYSQSPIRELGM